MKFKADHPITVFTPDHPPIEVRDEIDTDDKTVVKILRGVADVHEVKPAKGEKK